MSGHRKLFHWFANANTATVASAGLERGSTTRQKMVHSPAPSSRAASSRSRGIVRKTCRSRKIPHTDTSSVEISPAYVSTHPRALMIRKRGMSTPTAGPTSVRASTSTAPPAIQLAACGLRLAACGLRLAPCGLRLAPVSGILYPPAEQSELHPRHGEQDHEQEDRQRARVAELQEFPSGLVDPVGDDVSGMLRPAVREHVDVGEDLKRPDDAGDEHEQRHRS